MIDMTQDNESSTTLPTPKLTSCLSRLQAKLDKDESVATMTAQNSISKDGQEIDLRARGTTLHATMMGQADKLPAILQCVESHQATAAPAREM